jgi:outer membrane protein assembly factor BamB
MNPSGKAHRMVVRLASFHFLAWLGCCLLVGFSARAAEPLGATNLWSFWFRSDIFADDAWSTPAVAPDGTIYVGAFSGRLNAIRPDGKEKWHFEAGNQIKSSPAIADDGTIYFGARDRQFYALTPEGQLKWKFPTGAWVDSSAGIATDGTVYFGSWDKNFYALKPDGSLKWKFSVGGVVDSSPAIAADGTIYFGSHNKKFYALSPSGQPVWTFLTGAEITSSPAIGEDGSIYFTSTDGNLYRLKADGTEIWHSRVGGGGAGSPVLADNGNVAIGASNQSMILSPQGKILRTMPSPCWIDETPAVAQGTICFPAPWRQLWACDLNGNELWLAVATNNLTSSPVIGGDGIIYCSCGHLVEAFQAPVPLFPARSSWPMFRADARHTGRVGGG